MSGGLPATPSQTVGPFFHFGLPYENGPDIVPPWHPEAITLTGRVLDGAGEPVPDALVEIWQPDSRGRSAPTAHRGAAPVPGAAQAPGPGAEPGPAGALRRDSGAFSGFGRCATDADGRYRFTTCRPGPLGGGAPYLAMLVFARGLLKPVATRVYFAEDAAAHASDPLLSRVEPERRGTLVARPYDGGHLFDVRLQGDGETVFLAF